MDFADSNCPGGKTMSGKCPSQADHVKCCFTADTDEECATYNHPTAGQVGSCVSTSQCPGSFYISNLCPTKPNDIKCCFDKPTGTCSGGSDGPVPADCMQCICNVESNCQEIGCKWDVNSNSCGPYQIKYDYYTDALAINPNLGSGWESCTTKFACSEDTVQAYMTRYATHSRLGHTPTCEDFSRIHNGGPNGWNSPSTVGYWDKIQAQGCS
ncbi:Lysozyme 1 [Holothuria leucospilota]|uniref:lysozyme n=1 Tax=Holothuria leucospilota TaxID=206669 RepID=A0A9Q0YKM6_HOLLE|nr:Lysozyme 1 [Holothuria leucospilota]